MSFDKILIVDDEASIYRLLDHHLRRQNYTVSIATTLAEAEEFYKKERPDLVLLDLCLPDGDGLEFLKCKAHEAAAPAIVIMSGYSSMESAIRCIRAGAFDYMVKPFTLEEVQQVIHRAESIRPRPQRADAPPHDCDGRILGESSAMCNLRAMVMKVAPTDTPVLITGESGTGKERIAEAVHRASSRSGGPLIKVHCGAGREEQIEAELFGSRDTAGALELARGGTLLLEEIADLPLRAQVKLLRVLQQQQYEHPDGGAPRSTDIRLIATTQRNPDSCVAQGTLRQDLALRLSVLPLHVPPLRDRLADLPLLMARWAQAYGHRNGLTLGGFSDEALRALMAHSWPGNVRELENALERAVILTGFTPRVEAAAFEFLNRPASNPAVAPICPEQPLLTLDQLERQHVFRALEYTKQNRTRAAGLLKISVRTLRNKLHQYRNEDSALSCMQSHLAIVAPGVNVQR